MRQHKHDYDAFISHAVEDKIPIANELCAKLERAGLKIWYSGKELGVGDSIEKTIENGLNRSRYGIVIFSPTYLAKNWTIREFYTLLAKEIEEQKVILPVLYNITLDELKNKDMVMADRFAVNSDRGIDFVVERLVREIKKPQAVKARPAWFSRIWAALILSLLANAALLVKGSVLSDVPQPERYSAEPVYLPGNAESAFLDEIQTFISRFNRCSCDQQKEPAWAPAGDSQLMRKASYHAKSADNSDDQRFSAPVYRPGSKMTMAVVFQLETAGTQSAELQEEADRMVNTLTLPDTQENDPFISLVNERKEHRNECARNVRFSE